MIPVFLGMLQDALYYPWFTTGCTSRVIIWLGLTAFMYHLFAGIRHLCMDIGMGEDKVVATNSSYVVLAFTLIASIWIGMRLC